jgi:hypothetical protein
MLQKRAADFSMRMAHPIRTFVSVRVATCLVTGFALAGCSAGIVGGGSPSWFPSLPGFSSVSSSGNAGSALAAAPGLSMEDNCPTVDVRTGAGTLAVATKTQAATASDLRYQVTVVELARQCALVDNVIRMRVGVQARAVVGPAGAPNQIDVPLRYAIVREGVDPKTIVTKLRRVPVVFTPGSLNVLFTDIEEDLSFVLPPLEELQAYVVYVGFDEAALRGERPAPAAKKKKG